MYHVIFAKLQRFKMFLRLLAFHDILLLKQFSYTKVSCSRERFQKDVYTSAKIIHDIGIHCAKNHGDKKFGY